MKLQSNIILTALLSAATLALTSCGGQKNREIPQAKFKTTKPAVKSTTFENKYSATIRGRQDVDVYPQVGGTIQKICVTEGQRVSAGQTLFIIDQVPYQAALNTAEATLKAARASEATAQLNYDSKKTLRQQNVISDFELQTAENSLLSAKAQVGQAEAQVMNARNSLSYTVVKAPSSGVVGTLPYRQGALVSAQMPQPLTTVSDNKQMWVYFSIDEGDMLTWVRKYGSLDKAIENMPQVGLTLVDGSKYNLTGRVESVSGVVDRQTGSLQLRAVFDNPDGLLHSGSTGNVIMPIQYNDVIMIPATAVVQLQDKYKVWVVSKDSTAHERIIEISGKKSGAEFVVTNGLTTSDEIVAEGAGMVKAGQKVK